MPIGSTVSIDLPGVGAVHARITWRVGPRLGAVLIVVVFAIAFFTFFGVPFVSLAPHKGAV